MLLEGMGCSCSKGQGKIINGNGVEDRLPHRPSTQVEKILIAYCTACVTEDGSKENAILDYVNVKQSNFVVERLFVKEWY